MRGVRKNIADLIQESITEDATPEEYQVLSDDAISAESRGRMAYKGFMGRVNELRRMEAV